MSPLEVHPTPSADEMAAIAAALAIIERDAAARFVAARSLRTPSTWHKKARSKGALLDMRWTEAARLEALDAGV